MGALRNTLTLLLGIAMAGSVQANDILGPPTESGPVVVDVGFFLSDINDIDEEQETFEFEGLLTLRWTDPRQAFDPEETGGEDRFFQGSFQFSEVFEGWWPQIYLANESGNFDRQGVMLRVRPDGHMILVEEINATAETLMHLRRFPFDTQRFDAIFEVLGFGRDEVVLRADPETTGMWDDEYHQVRVPQWNPPILRTSVRDYDPLYGGATSESADHAAAVFVMSLEMKRDPGYMVWLVIFPLAMLVILSWSVFWMNRSSLGDRMDISFIGILTVVAYQITISGLIPRISYLTVMGAFVLVSFVMMCGSVIANLVVGRIDQSGNLALGDRVDLVCRRAFPAAYVLALALACGTIYLRS